ncbi:MAG: MFS transporter [Syntrophobacteraceae bacterium]
MFGPLLYGTISSRTDNPRIALLSLETLFILGLIFMLMVPRKASDVGQSSAEQ